MSVRDELRAINEGFADALAKQDLERVMDFYADDARLLFHGIPMVKGREDIEALWRDELEEPSTVRFESGEIFEGGSLVIDVGRYESGSGVGKYVVVYQRQADGTLKCIIDAGLSDSTPAARS
jgi:ketosteroid isomerase-like protein